MKKRIVIVGGGISGLAAAFEIQELLAAQNFAFDLTVLEADDRLGGKIHSERRDGFLVEWGPNGFLDSREATVRLCQRLGLQDELLPSSDAARKRFVYAAGRLHQLPESPQAFLKSELLSTSGKLRLAGEILVPRRTATSEETLAGFCRRRLGDEALQRLIGPMASGIFAGNPAEMSLSACFPKIFQLEGTHGGLFRGMIALQRQKRRESLAAGKTADAPKVQTSPGGRLTSFKGGVGTLVEALRYRLGDAVKTGTPVRQLAMGRKYWNLHVGPELSPQKLSADVVVLATPAYASASLLEPLDQEMAREAAAIPYAPVAVVALGWEKRLLARDLDGFGFLVARDAPRTILGSLWSSSIFPGHRAGDDFVLLRNIIGGQSQPELAGLPEDELIARVIHDLREIVGISARPTFTRVVTWPQAIPQYTRGHWARVEALRKGEERHPGLFLGGNAYRGVGLNDCVEDARRLATLVSERLQSIET